MEGGRGARLLEGLRGSDLVPELNGQVVKHTRPQFILHPVPPVVAVGVEQPAPLYHGRGGARPSFEGLGRDRASVQHTKVNSLAQRYM